MLRLETEAVTPAIHSAIPADNAAIEEVARIELQRRLGGVQLYRAARCGILEPRGQA